MIDADEELASDRQGGAAAPAAALQFVVFGLEEAAALARCGDDSIARGGLQIGLSGAGAGRPALAGALVVGGAGAGPGGEMAGTGKTDMSTPISATMVAAITQSIPGIVIS